MLRRSESTTAQAFAFSRLAISKMVRNALPFPGIPWYGVMILCSGLCCSLISRVPRSTTARETASGVPSDEPPSELTKTTRDRAKYLASPALTARTTWPIVSVLL